MKSYEIAPHFQLANMSRWYVVSRAIHSMAALGIANFMKDELTPITEIAQKTETDPLCLERMLRFLSTYQVVMYEPGYAALTPLSKPLRDDDPYSIRDVLCMVDEKWWQAFSHVGSVLKTGRSGFYEAHGDSFFKYLEKFPEKQMRFDSGMAKLSEYDDKTISQAFSFHEFSHVAELGGGKGGLSRALALAYPSLTITLLDTPQVINALNPDTFPKNITLYPGNFFSTLPSADAYLFKGVLHDFNDEDMKKIFMNCYQTMSHTAKLIIAEQILPNDTKSPHPNYTMDIVMMMLLGGRQRTLREWLSILLPLGFVFENTYPCDSLFTVMVFAKH